MEEALRSCVTISARITLSGKFVLVKQWGQGDFVITAMMVVIAINSDFSFFTVN